MDDITIVKRKGIWWVQLWWGNKTWERGYHYKKDAITFAEDIRKHKQIYSITFHPDMLHMYPIEEA